MSQLIDPRPLRGSWTLAASGQPLNSAVLISTACERMCPATAMAARTTFLGPGRIDWNNAYAG